MCRSNKNSLCMDRWQDCEYACLIADDILSSYGLPTDFYDDEQVDHLEIVMKLFYNQIQDITIAKWKRMVTEYCKEHY